MRLSSREWQGDRRFDAVLFALLAHGVAVVALGLAAGQRGPRVERAQRTTLRERAEYLQFVAPRVEATVPRTLAHSDPRSRRRQTLSPPRETPAPVRDTGAALATSPPAVVPATGFMTAPLPADGRLLVGPAAGSGVADVRVRDANAFIASRVRAAQDSAWRHDHVGWTVGDSTHQYGLAKCGIALGTICIPFGFASMPSPRPKFDAVDRKREEDAEFGAAIDRVRAMRSRPSDGPPDGPPDAPPPRTGP